MFTLPTRDTNAAHFADCLPGFWAKESGNDQFGCWAVLGLDDLRQVFRWIPAGRFLMGSPESATERCDNEMLHHVTLSRGFWLADTATTQAFWQAVMGWNPSQFQDDPRNPVESVSWLDVMAFIDELNRRVPGLLARLPSEAEWEYACRAGTTTSFSFGDNITLDQVNCNLNYPYAGVRKERSRERTVPVGSLPANPWGLYEMHGNTNEWCADWYAKYQARPQTDPHGPPFGKERVLRGGSCWDPVGCARSASRSRNVPTDNLYHVVGFRLALSQGEPTGIESPV